MRDILYIYIYLFYLFIYLIIYLSICISNLSIYLVWERGHSLWGWWETCSIYLSNIYISIYLSINIYIFLFIYLSIYLLIYLSRRTGTYTARPLGWWGTFLPDTTLTQGKGVYIFKQNNFCPPHLFAMRFVPQKNLEIVS